MPSATKTKILTSAVAVFALSPYHEVTVAKICEKAGTNIASVNYHFGSKDALYRNVIREAFRVADATYPIDGALSQAASAAQRLHAFMGAIIRRSFDAGPAGDFNRIMGFVARDSGEQVELVFEEVDALEHDYLDRVIASLIGNLEELTKTQARMNVISLAAIFVLMSRATQVIFENGPSAQQIETFIDQQHAFALHGLNNLKAVSPVHS